MTRQWTHQWLESGWMGGQIDKWMGGEWMDGWMDGLWMDKLMIDGGCTVADG